MVVEEISDETFPFRVVFSASILDHLNKVDESQMPGVVRSALQEICEASQQLRLNTVATALLKGGWRMHASKAFDAMVTVVDEFKGYDATLFLYSPLQEQHDYLEGLARSYGLAR